jgi:hypothetical protein
MALRDIGILVFCPVLRICRKSRGNSQTGGLCILRRQEKLVQAFNCPYPHHQLCLQTFLFHVCPLPENYNPKPRCMNGHWALALMISAQLCNRWDYFLLSCVWPVHSIYANYLAEVDKQVFCSRSGQGWKCRPPHTKEKVMLEFFSDQCQPVKMNAATVVPEMFLVSWSRAQVRETEKWK